MYFFFHKTIFVFLIEIQTGQLLKISQYRITSIDAAENDAACFGKNYCSRFEGIEMCA